MSGNAEVHPDATWTRQLGKALRSARSGRARWRLELIDGPNMSNLGKGGRDARTYGQVTSLAALHDALIAMAEGLGVAMTSYQSNREGDIVAHLYDTAPQRDAYLINPAAMTRFSVPCRIALADTRRPFVEMHFANTAAVGWLRGGPMTPDATGVSMGLRHYSYMGALFGLVGALDAGLAQADFHGVPLDGPPK
jgi:3-dehydroquinate dehydratase-2